MLIKGVVLKPLKIFNDDRGFLFEALRDDDTFYQKFGQSTVTLSYPGVIKAFHFHEHQDDFWVCIDGMIQVVLYDLRPESNTYKCTNQFCVGEHNRTGIFIPRIVAHGYRVLGNKPAILMYHTNNNYNPCKPDEFRVDYDDPEIRFDWTTQPR